MKLSKTGFGLFLTSILCISNVLAFDISSDQKIDGTTAPQITGAGLGNTVTATGATPNWTFNWSGVTTPGLNLGSYMLYCNYNDNGQGTLTLDLAGGDIIGTGDLAIRTYLGLEGANYHSDHLVIKNVGNINAGGIDAHANNKAVSGSTANPGNVTIGIPAARAGNIRVNYIYAQAGLGLRGYENGNGNAGSITIYSSGNVLI